MTQHFKAQIVNGFSYVARAHIIAVDVPNQSAFMGADKGKEAIIIHLTGGLTVRIFSTENQREFLAWLNTPPAYVPPVPDFPTWPPPGQQRDARGLPQ